MAEKRLIVTADDFGISAEVNQAVEDAHLKGILTATSLMVGEDFAVDAVDRAKRLPNLAVGLHLAVSRAKPVLPRDQIPNLVDDKGLLKADLVGSGFRFFFLPRVRKQLAAEIRAQFQAFQETGLPLDHVNAHNHLHLHPTVLSMMLNIGRDFGLKAVRIPQDPKAPLFLKPWLSLMKARLRGRGIRHNDRMFGLQETGRLDTKALHQFLENLPTGISEIMCHPATGVWDGIDPEAEHFKFNDEFAALVDDAVVATVKKECITLSAFRDI